MEYNHEVWTYNYLLVMLMFNFLAVCLLVLNCRLQVTTIGFCCTLQLDSHVATATVYSPQFLRYNDFILIQFLHIHHNRNLRVSSILINFLLVFLTLSLFFPVLTHLPERTLPLHMYVYKYYDCAGFC